jgi:hypothetical protein
LYANAFPFNKENPFAVKGALAHRRGIELVTLSHNNVVHLEPLSWTAGGSAARLAEFFSDERNPIALALNDLLDKSNLKLYERGPPSRFLGMGGTGSVFLVDWSQGGARRGMALKVAAGAINVGRLSSEFHNNRKVAERAADVIVKATDLFISEVTEAAGFLMEEVGREVDLVDLERALEALASLHKAGFCHGDARRQNLLTCLGKLKWCDLQLALDISTMREGAARRKFSDDVSTLLKSFGVAVRGHQLDEVLLKEYASNVSTESLRALVAKSVAGPP